MKERVKRETGQIRSSLRTSTIEGSWWAVMYGMVETYFGAFFEYLHFFALAFNQLNFCNTLKHADFFKKKFLFYCYRGGRYLWAIL